jgi:predicted dehydrogenase
LYGLPIKRALAQAPGLLGLTARLILRWPQMFKYLPGLSKYYYWRDWPTNTIGSNLSPEGIRQTLAETNFGRCAYRCDNDQLEHQETLIEFDSGATAVFRLHGLSHTEGRTMRIDGTKATLRARFGSGSQITVYPHHGKSPRNYPVDSDFIGHKQADALLMTEWSQILQGKPSPTNAKISALSHYLALAAQRAVTSKCWQNLNELTQ